MNHSISQEEVRTENKNSRTHWIGPRNIQHMLWSIQRHGIVRSIRIHHIILPCRKMRISLRKGTRRTTSMMRRRDFFLFISLFLPYRRWRLKIQLANFVTKLKDGNNLQNEDLTLERKRRTIWPAKQPCRLVSINSK